MNNWEHDQELDQALEEIRPLLEEQPENDKSEKIDQKKREQQDFKKNILLYFHDLACLLCGMMLILLLCFRAVIVEGDSMNSTLIDGDYLLLLNNIFYTDPQPGDIVVAAKESFRDGEPIIKRVIAIEGQVVDIDFDKGIVYVDGVALDEPYVYSPTTNSEGVRFPLTVEKGCVFVMGDNRSFSRDSRYPEIGQIDRRQLLGKAIFLLLPGTDGGTSPRKFYRIGAL